MPTCPVCLFNSPPGTPVCTGCGRFRFPANGSDSGRVEFSNEYKGDSADNPSLSALKLRQALPAAEPLDRTVRGPITVPLSALAGGPEGVLTQSAPKSALTQPASRPISVAPPPRLVVTRGQKPNAEFPIYDGRNYIGRASDKPADIDLTAQEDPTQVWSSRQHAVVMYDRGVMLIEDLNSLNGTYVNRSRLHPGQQRVLHPNDIITIGTVHMKVVV
jgi:pSer/pThr/pTyr-binding forkhead associated (FHA) protein